MTARERQILGWIEEDPLISQEALAEKAGITRSSVGVHVSNLMKKGYLAGRGYVLGKRCDVTVVGGCNVDVGGVSAETLIERDSNPGTVSVTPGGVGRNIAHNLSLLDVRVRLLTAFGDDVFAGRIEESCKKHGVDVSAALKVPGERTGVYLYIAGRDGDMALAVSDMDIFRHITPAFLQEKLPADPGVVVADTNIPEETLRYLSSLPDVPLFVDPVSVTKAAKLKDCLPGIHTLKPNLPEAQALSGVAIRTDADVEKAAAVLRQKGVRRVFISLGKRGVYADDGETKGFFPPVRADAVNTTGAGDAFMAGLVAAFLDNRDLPSTVRFASAAAAVAVESPDTIAADMSREAVENKLRSL